ncbi:unnamed protein product, partial [Protopolystoma xenopodis]
MARISTLGMCTKHAHRYNSTQLQMRMPFADEQAHVYTTTKHFEVSIYMPDSLGYSTVTTDRASVLTLGSGASTNQTYLFAGPPSGRTSLSPTRPSSVSYRGSRMPEHSSGLVRSRRGHGRHERPELPVPAEYTVGISASRLVSFSCLKSLILLVCLSSICFITARGDGRSGTIGPQRLQPSTDTRRFARVQHLNPTAPLAGAPATACALFHALPGDLAEIWQVSAGGDLLRRLARLPVNGSLKQDGEPLLGRAEPEQLTTCHVIRPRPDGENGEDIVSQTFVVNEGQDTSYLGQHI